jgi:uncharacterized protein YbbC (DUF1343 family)/CubicO group peptidase (beta-lactamase class C family)
MKFLLAALFTAAAFAQSFSASPDLDALLDQAVQEDRIPGAVLLVGQKGTVIHRKAYGYRALVPSKEEMTLDTIFDCASLTKVVATTSSMMKLFEQGKVRLADKVTAYLPEFQGGKTGITVQDLMTHFSGLRPDLDLQPPWSGYDTGIRKALSDPPAHPPETKFVYSDINFELLGEIVRRVSKDSLPDFAHKMVFGPLGMTDTMFLPPASLRPRIAPTERQKDGEILRGVVHDTTARYMGGVAGHAGLFSTADDLSKFCQMMLDLGDKIFSPLTIEKFTTPQSPLNQPVLRGLGWDIDSPLSGNRGELFPAGRSYGHTGFTGTSIWIDPGSQTYVILLTNSVHPRQRPSITSLRAKVATIVAAAVGYEYPNVSGPGVSTGLDVLAAQHFRLFDGKRVGLITNPTGIDREGRRNTDLMAAAGVKIAALFSPEHGFAGAEDQPNVANTTDPVTGIKVFSLYSGKNRRPSAEMLRGLDALVFDIADVGARFYTYMTTMEFALEEAAKAHIPFYVLDRPNPITGLHVEGPILDPDKFSFVGNFPVPLRHGLTAGELARMYNGENHVGADLTVVPMEGWRRSDWFDSTGLPWVNPSPNIRNLTEAVLYPALAMLEASPNYSVGRGTDSPFEVIGADFIRGSELAAYLKGRSIPGVRMYPLRFQPVASNFKSKSIEGIQFIVTDRDVLDTALLGLEVAGALQKLYPGKIEWTVNRYLIGNQEAMDALARGDDPKEIRKNEEKALESFRVLRVKYLLYR